MQLNRRHFLAGAAVLAAQSAVPSLLRGQAAQPLYPTRKLPFHLAVINDEISPDFDHACHVAANEFGLQFIELRGLWDKNIADLTDAEIAEARRILAKYKLTVSDICSPLFKTEFPGGKTAPGATVDQFGATFTYARQNEVLERSIHLAKSFSTPRIRCFDFIRLADPKPHLLEIYEQLRKASATLAKDNLILLLENELTCNTSTSIEAAATLAAVQNPNFMLNWDPANAAAVNDEPFPAGYNRLPKNRIGHCHIKDVMRRTGSEPQWAAVGSGVVDWRGQIQALIRQKFKYTVSLETHWLGAGTAEASTRQSMAGLQKILAAIGV
jgi:sugar phosphate isomerase/epimerase